MEPNHQLVAFTFTSINCNPTYGVFRSEFQTLHHYSIFGC